MFSYKGILRQIFNRFVFSEYLPAPKGGYYTHKLRACEGTELSF